MNSEMAGFILRPGAGLSKDQKPFRARNPFAKLHPLVLEG